MKELNKKAILNNLNENDIDIHIFSSIDSTNSQCKRQELSKKYLLVLSEQQSEGRGRTGKSWSSPELGNIYMSLAFKNAFNNSPLSLIVGSIVAEAIKSITNSEHIGLKWPNDILLKNKKIGGILVENEIQNNNVKTIIGIGINLNLEEKEDWWGDLSEFKNEIDRNNLISQISSMIIDFIDSNKFDWKDFWTNNCVHMDKKIQIIINNKTILEGIFIGIEDDGSMNLKVDNNIKNFKFGEISIQGVY